MPIRPEYHAKCAGSAMKFNSIIFDLDGTLVDSAPGILRSFGHAMTVTGITPARALTPDIIGPPLADTLRALCPHADVATLAKVTAAFKQHYDTEGCLQTRPFEGIPELLKMLNAAGCAVFIATNKRQFPTHKIISHLHWNSHFVAVYSPDSIHPHANSKGELLRHILEKHGLATEATLYVGDRYDDYEAAAYSGMAFAFATWGFGTDDTLVPQECERLETAESVSHLAVSGFAKTS